MPTKCQCSQCGSTDFKKEGDKFLRCAHCSSLFKMHSQELENNSPKVVIKGGANVILAKIRMLLLKVDCS